MCRESQWYFQTSRQQVCQTAHRTALERKYRLVYLGSAIRCQIRTVLTYFARSHRRTTRTFPTGSDQQYRTMRGMFQIDFERSHPRTKATLRTGHHPQKSGFVQRSSCLKTAKAKRCHWLTRLHFQKGHPQSWYWRYSDWPCQRDCQNLRRRKLDCRTKKTWLRSYPEEKRREHGQRKTVGNLWIIENSLSPRIRRPGGQWKRNDGYKRMRDRKSVV